MIEKYDALVVVHFDFNVVTHNQDFSINVNRAIAQFLDVKKPVVVLPSVYPIIRTYDINTTGTLQFDRKSSAETDANTSVAMIGKKPADIIIAFGGMYGRNCVNIMAEKLCQETVCSREVFPTCGWRAS